MVSPALAVQLRLPLFQLGGFNVADVQDVADVVLGQERREILARIFCAPVTQQGPEAQVQVPGEFVPPLDQIRVFVTVVQESAD